MGNKVLILIILEYIYIKKSWKSKNEIPYGVLILIILEYIYIKLESEMLLNGTGLNPYYTGIHLHIGERKRDLCNDLCLNPYYTGIHLHSTYNRDPCCPRCVLILIILEYIYIMDTGTHNSR